MGTCPECGGPIDREKQTPGEWLVDFVWVQAMAKGDKVHMDAMDADFGRSAAYMRPDGVIEYIGGSYGGKTLTRGAAAEFIDAGRAAWAAMLQDT